MKKEYKESEKNGSECDMGNGLQDVCSTSAFSGPQIKRAFVVQSLYRVSMFYPSYLTAILSVTTNLITPREKVIVFI